MDEGLYVTNARANANALMALHYLDFPVTISHFLDFLPNKTKARKDILSKWKHSESTLVIFESASRIESSCRIWDIFGDRQNGVDRTNQNSKEVWSGNISEIQRVLKKTELPKERSCWLLNGYRQRTKCAIWITLIKKHWKPCL